MSISKTWDIYKKSFSLSVSSWMVYRFNFFLYLASVAFVNLFVPMIVYLIYYNGLSFAGWTLYEALLLLGTFTLVGGISSVTTSSVSWATYNDIRDGTFDNLLIRPFSPLKQLIIRIPEVEEFPSSILGILIIIFSIYKLDITLSVFNVLLYILLILLGVVFLASMDIFAGSLSFIFVNASAIKNLFWDATSFAKYPLSIYGATGTIIFTFVLPIGLMAFYPTEALLGRLSMNVVLLGSVAFAFLGASLVAWHFAIRRYVSVGG
jgi:ABC-2 type transport system permease protein